jgi:hypothetical protein
VLFVSESGVRKDGGVREDDVRDRGGEEHERRGGEFKINSDDEGPSKELSSPPSDDEGDGERTRERTG